MLPSPLDRGSEVILDELYDLGFLYGHSVMSNKWKLNPSSNLVSEFRVQQPAHQLHLR